MSCRLTGLGVNGGPPVATWQGSSSVVLKKSQTRNASYTNHLQRSGRYLQSYLRFQAHTKLLMSPTPSSVFARLTPQQRIDARNIVNAATKEWRDATRKWKGLYFVVPGFVPYDKLKSNDLTACFDSLPSSELESRAKFAEKKILQSVGKPSFADYGADYAFKSFQKLLQQPDQNILEKLRKETPDSLVWWYIKLNPALLDERQNFFEILDDVKFKDTKKVPKELIKLGNVFNHTQDEIIYDNLQPVFSDIVEQFRGNARRIAARSSMVCAKAHRAYWNNGTLVPDLRNDHSAHSTAAGTKLLLYLAYHGHEDVNPVDKFTEGIEEVYSQMKANGIALEDTAVPSNVETKPVFDSVYASTPEDDSTQPTDTLSTEQWIEKLEDAFGKNV
jgi:hypothetical protein